jgi:hypothetical protein
MIELCNTNYYIEKKSALYKKTKFQKQDAIFIGWNSDLVMF